MQTRLRGQGSGVRGQGSAASSAQSRLPDPDPRLPAPDPRPFWGLIRSFGYAIAGILQLVRRQRNAQIHLFVTVVVCAASWAWGLSRIEWLILILTIALVLGMEAVNTAIEAVVDLASPHFHPLAKQAKDVAAGGVLIVAIGAAGVALLLYGTRLLELVRWLLG